MYERIQRTGNHRRVQIGAGEESIEEEFKVLSADYRLTLETFWNIVDAQRYLENQVKMERTACSTGGCDD